MKEILLTQGKVTLVDDEDYERLNQFKWHAAKMQSVNFYTFYVHRWNWNNGKPPINVFMHREIMNPPKNLEIDHIDGNTLNNQKSNLRIVTTRQNAQNRHMIKSSQYPGISWYKRRHNWMVRITYNGKRRYLGTFKNELEAATVYRVACAVLIK